MKRFKYVAIVLCGLLLTTGCSANPLLSAKDNNSEERDTVEQTELKQDNKTEERDIEEADTEADSTDTTKEDTAEWAYRQAYIDTINAYVSEHPDSNLIYDLVYIDDDDIPELMIGVLGYYDNLYTYSDGEVKQLMDCWPYGAGGNPGYEYIPRQNVIRNYNSDMAGAIRYVYYYGMDSNCELEPYFDGSLSIWFFNDANHNYMIDEGEYDENNPVEYYYYNDQEITAEEYNSYLIEGDYEWLEGTMTYDEIMTRLQ